MFERLTSSTQIPVTAGEQLVLAQMEWAEADLLAGNDERFEHTLLLLRRMKDLDRHGQARPPGFEDEDSSSAVPVEVPEDQNGPDWQRALMLAREVARIARTRQAVRGFRQRVLGEPSRVLADEKAVALLRSPALRLVPAEEMEARGIRADDHRTNEHERSWGLLTDGIWEEVRLSIEWDHGTWDLTRRIEWKAGNSRRLQAPPALEGAGDLLVVADSTLDDLRRTAHAIARPLGWTEPDAAWFLLTGIVRVVAPVRATTSVNLANQGEFQLAEVTITAQPYASPATVAALFSAAQRRLTGRRKGRSIPEWNLRLFDFVRQNTTGGEPISNWDALRKQWNKTVRPAWRYHSYRAIRRDYYGTRKGLLFPGYAAGSSIERETGDPPDESDPRPVRKPSGASARESVPKQK
jgi:hypothetical protein